MGSSWSQNPVAPPHPENSWVAPPGTEYQDGTFEWEAGGRRMFFRALRKQAPDGVVFMNHGMAVSSYHESELANALCANANVDVLAMDHIGHGRSDGRLLDIPDFELLVSSQFDFIMHVLRSEPRYANLPVFITGDSMGGAIALLLATRLPPGVLSGAVFTSAGFVIPDLPPYIVQTLVRGLKFVLPHGKAAEQRYDALTRDAAKKDLLLTEPYKIHGPVSMRTGASIVDLSLATVEAMPSMRVPFLTCHGSGDKYTDPAGSKLLFDLAPLSEKDKQIILYEGAYHDLFHELDEVSSAVLNDIVGWVKTRIASRQQ